MTTSEKMSAYFFAKSFSNNSFDMLSTLDQAPAVQASEVLSRLDLAASQVRVPQVIANFGPQDRVARVTRGPAGNFVELYRAPTTPIGTNASGALVPIPFVPFTNGAETSILILSQGGTPLSAGTCTIHAVLEEIFGSVQGP